MCNPYLIKYLIYKNHEALYIKIIIRFLQARETNAGFRETQISVDDFDLDYLYDEYGTYKDCRSDNEEQLCRHIACLNKIKSKSMELKKNSFNQK
jgi:hypothetical protein